MGPLLSSDLPSISPCIHRTLPTFPPSDLPTFTPSDLPTFPPSDLPTFTPIFPPSDLNLKFPLFPLIGVMTVYKVCPKGNFFFAVEGLRKNCGRYKNSQTKYTPLLKGLIYLLTLVFL